MAYATVWGSHRLESAAAASYLRARRDGLPAGITSALRTHAEQVALFLSRYAVVAGSGPYGDVRYYNGRRYVRVRGAAVAVPGSSYSRHEQGLSLDLPAGGPREWMRSNGYRYGWIKDIVKGESWHFEYQAARDAVKVSNPSTGGGTVPTPPVVTAPTPIAPTEDEDMARIIARGNEPAIYLNAPALGLHYHIPNGEELAHLQGIYGGLRRLGAREFDVVRQAALSVQARQNATIGAAVVNTPIDQGTGTLAQTTRDARIIARRSEDPIARLVSQRCTATTPDGKVWLMDVPAGICAHIPDPNTLTKMGARWADPAQRIALSAADFAVLQNMAKIVNKSRAA